MDEEKWCVYIYNEILFSLKKEGSSAMCNNMNKPGEYYAIIII